MKSKLIYILISLIGLISFGTCLLNQPVDILKNYDDLSTISNDPSKLETLIKKMENAYGGRANWENHDSLFFIQEADWYGRLKISHWDASPQFFKMTAHLGSNNCEMTLLNGKNKGDEFQVKGDKYFIKKSNRDDWILNEEKRFYEKMIYKNYWFQFPFRIGEASIKKYFGQKKVAGIDYELIYATWGSEKANKDYDQFVLYLNAETHLIEYLHFTVRDKMKSLGLTARFADFRKVEDFTFPHSQFITLGKPGSKEKKMHENHYKKIDVKKL